MGWQGGSTDCGDFERFVILDAMFYKKKNLIISAVMYPRISPRELRATELAKELASQGHKVILFAVSAEYYYTEFEKIPMLRLSHGKNFFSRLDSDDSYSFIFVYENCIFHLSHYRPY